MTDVPGPTVVVGNGPAGLAALGASPSGTWMVAPTETPDPGVCGGVLTPPACEFLRDRELIDPLLEKGARFLEGVCVATSKRFLINRDLNDSNLISWDRSSLDRFLQNHLVEEGHALLVDYVRKVRIQETGVELVLRSGRTRWAQGVVDATGHRRLMSSRTSSRGRTGPDLVGLEWRQTLSRRPRARLDLVLFPGGYAGVAPAGDRRIVISAVTSQDAYQSAGPSGVWDILRTHAPEETPIGETTPGKPRVKGGFWSLPYPIVAPRWVAVGDAAGFTMPLSGEGIFNALRQGAIAGEFLTDRERRNRPIWPLEDESRRVLRRDLGDPFRRQLWRWRAAHWAGMNPWLLEYVDRFAPGVNRWLFERCFPNPERWEQTD